MNLTHFWRRPLLLATVVLLSACASQTKESNILNISEPSGQDRQAILAMAGEYAVDFEFSDNLILAEGIEEHEPHYSSAKEYVFVLENSPKRIVLQHLLLTNRNHVIKHWRQDWEYEQTDFWQYEGNYRWRQHAVTPEQVQGKWLQTVWQVDDSPRYAGIGAWEHSHGVSRWTSDVSWRPLPRREHTTRKDYNVLEGINRHTITPTGWVHEQYNYKLDLKTDRIIAHELGKNTYARITDIDFTPAREYWEKTSAYWEAVRDFWQDVITTNSQWQLEWVDTNDHQDHYMRVLEQAEQADTHATTHEQRKAQVAETLRPFLTVSP